MSYYRRRNGCMSLYVPVVRTPFFLVGAIIIIVVFWGFAALLFPFSVIYVLWGILMEITTLDLNFFNGYHPICVEVIKKSFEVLKDIFNWWLWKN